MNKNIQLPWIEKYRPSDTEQILLDNMLLEKINKIIESKSIPNMILTGEPGTGKTSTVLIIARELFKEDYNENVLELNASDDRGLSIINNTIIPFCQKITKAPEKLIILDEADSITNKAQNLLSNLINEFKKNCRFVFVCNDSIKINESIQSKCIIVNFPKLTDINIRDKLIEICDKESITYTDDFIDELILFPPKSKLRYYYALLLRIFGFGYHKEGKSISEWCIHKCNWLDNWTFKNKNFYLFVTANVNSNDWCYLFSF